MSVLVFLLCKYVLPVGENNYCNLVRREILNSKGQIQKTQCGGSKHSGFSYQLGWFEWLYSTTLLSGEEFSDMAPDYFAHFWGKRPHVYFAQDYAPYGKCLPPTRMP